MLPPCINTQFLGLLASDSCVILLHLGYRHVGTSVFVVTARSVCARQHKRALMLQSCFESSVLFHLARITYKTIVDSQVLHPFINMGFEL
jgi:hypothetical protein